jgi:hypothetical protein
MRNIGSSVGTSMVTALLARRVQFRQSVLVYRATTYDPAFRDTVNGLAQQLAHSVATAPDAKLQPVGRIYQELRAQAQTLAYLDTFGAGDRRFHHVCAIVHRPPERSARGWRSGCGVIAARRRSP